MIRKKFQFYKNFSLHQYFFSCELRQKKLFRRFLFFLEKFYEKKNTLLCFYLILPIEFKRPENSIYLL